MARLWFPLISAFSLNAFTIPLRAFHALCVENLTHLAKITRSSAELLGISWIVRVASQLL